MNGNNTKLKAFQKWTIYTLLVFMLLSFWNVPQQAAAEATPVSADAPLKVMTYNINLGKNANGTYDLAGLADAIQTSGADVIGLQKVDKYYSSRSNFEDQTKVLAESLGMHYVFAANVDNDPPTGQTERAQFGTAILSKYPIVSSMNHRIGTQSTKEQRGLLEAKIALGKKEIYFYTTHLGTTPEKRTEEIGNIMNIIGAKAAPQIITGLFNASPGSLELAALAPTFTDTLDGKINVNNFPAASPTSRNAYIYVNSAWGIASSEAVQTLASSDLPIVSELVLRSTNVPSSNAKLAKLEVNSSAVSDFSADEYTYNITLAQSASAIPVVTATPEDAMASIQIQDTTSIPGSTVITVVSEDASRVLIYTLNFTLAPAVPEPDPVNSIKVMTYNINLGTNANGIYDLKGLAEAIRESGADVIGLQKVDRYYSTRSLFDDQAKALATSLGMYYAFGANVDRNPQAGQTERSQFGTAILSKYPIVSSTNHKIGTQSTSEQRGLLEAKIALGKKEIYFYTTHLGTNTAKRTEEIGNIIRIVESQAGPKIISGLFNAAPGSPEFGALWPQFADTLNKRLDAKNFPANNPNTRNAYLYVTSDWKVTSAYVTSTLASSDLPVVSELQLREAPASPNAKLAGLAIDGANIPSFEPDKYVYQVALPKGTSTVPDVTINPQDEKAAIVVQKATGFPGNTVIQVTSEDERTVLTYLVHFKVEPEVAGWQVPLRMMSFNIRAGRNNDGVLNLEKTGDVIRNSGADIVGLQEVDKHFSDRSNFIDQAKWLAEYLDMEYAFGYNLDLDPLAPDQERRQYGNAILSKYPITSAKNYHLESFGGEQRGLLETHINVLGTDVAFYSAHLGLTSEQRVVQAEQVLEIMGKAGSPRMITGDFNAEISSPELQRFLQEGLVDSFAHHLGEYTFEAKAPFKSIDFMLHSPEFTVTDTVIMPDQVSDHLALYTDVLLETPLNSIAFKDEEVTLDLQQTYSSTVFAHYNNGFVADMTDGVQFESSSNVVTLSPEGFITAQAAGETVVTATYESFQATMLIKVHAKMDTGDYVDLDTSDNQGAPWNSGASSNPGGQGEKTSNQNHVVKLPNGSGIVEVDQQIASSSVEIVSEHFRFVFTSNQLQAMLKAQSNNPANKDNNLTIRVEQVPDDKERAALQNAKAKYGTGLNAIGKMINIALVWKNSGELANINGADFMDLSFKLPVGNSYDPKRTGIYEISDDGTLTYRGGILTKPGMNHNLPAQVSFVILEFVKNYVDLPSTHWVNEAVSSLSAMQIIEGITPDRFEPSEVTNRAQFAALISRTLNLQASELSTFNDVLEEDWFAGSIGALVQAGFIQGKENGQFSPSEGISREEMAVVIARILTTQGFVKSGASESSFEDQQMISDWAQESVALAKAAGIINGKADGIFDPDTALTRAETAQVIHNLLVWIGNHK